MHGAVLATVAEAALSQIAPPLICLKEIAMRAHPYTSLEGWGGLKLGDGGTKI